MVDIMLTADIDHHPVDGPARKGEGCGVVRRYRRSAIPARSCTRLLVGDAGNPGLWAIRRGKMTGSSRSCEFVEKYILSLSV
jgi:hypothetical protein